MTSELHASVSRHENSCELVAKKSIELHNQKIPGWLGRPQFAAKRLDTILEPWNHQQPPPPGSSGIPHRSRFVPLSQRGALGPAAPVLKAKIHP